MKGPRAGGWVVFSRTERRCVGSLHRPSDKATLPTPGSSGFGVKGFVQRRRPRSSGKTRHRTQSLTPSGRSALPMRSRNPIPCIHDRISRQPTRVMLPSLERRSQLLEHFFAPAGAILFLLTFGRLNAERPGDAPCTPLGGTRLRRHQIRSLSAVEPGDAARRTGARAHAR